MSGEHGDGLSRSRYLPRHFGPRVVEAFKRVKLAFDPECRMNPGKIVASPRIQDHMRYGDGYRATVPVTAFRFAEDGGMDRAVELCNGMAQCRKLGAGAMCPSYRATREEEHSTRGRANLLRAALDGRLPGGLKSPELHEALDLCLECKSCKTECSARVDMARLKAESLWQRRGTDAPLRDRLFGRLDRYARLAQPFAQLVNRAAASPRLKGFLDRRLGIARERALPPLAPRAFTAWFEEHEEDRLCEPGYGDRPGVALFVDTYLERFVPDLGRAAVAVLEASGFRVLHARNVCCGRTRISKGFLAEARELAREGQERLRRWSGRGIPVVGLEPSCVLTVRDDHPDLVPEGTPVTDVLLLEEFLCGLRDRGRSAFPFHAAPRRFLLHGHCHQRALAGTTTAVRALKLIPGAEVRDLDGGCCGMAGSFGYEREHYDLSVRIAEDRLLPAVRARAEGEELVVPGISCRQQVEHLTGVRALHPAEALAGSLDPVRG
jgi:Fe-S oxidoreductase